MTSRRPFSLARGVLLRNARHTTGVFLTPPAIYAFTIFPQLRHFSRSKTNVILSSKSHAQATQSPAQQILLLIAAATTTTTSPPPNAAGSQDNYHPGYLVSILHATLPLLLFFL